MARREWRRGKCPGGYARERFPLTLPLSAASLGSFLTRRTIVLARVGAIVEEPRFHGHLRGRENLEIAAAVRGGDAYLRIDKSLEPVGLTARGARSGEDDSLGMRQRLGIARRLLADPELLILDEPNGLEPAGILEFRGSCAPS